MQHDAVIRIRDDTGSWVHSADRLVHRVQGNQGQQWGTASALWRPGPGGKELVIFHDARVEPGVELPTDHACCLCFSQKSLMTDTVEALGNIDLEGLLWSKFNAVQDRFNGIPTGASWTKAIGLRRPFGLPVRFQGLTHERLLRPIVLGRNPERALVWRCSTLGNPGASERGRLTIESDRIGKCDTFCWREELHRVDARCVLSPVILGHTTHREQSCGP
jgi:hypothetical protein